MSRDSTRHAAATGRPHRKIGGSAWAKACATASCTGAGSPASTWGLRASRSRAGTARPPSASSSRATKTEPNTAIPKDAPIWRKKFDDDVAAPSSAGGTAFCTIRTRFCMRQPMPRPVTAIPAAVRAYGVDSLISESSASPAAITAEPSTGQCL